MFDVDDNRTLDETEFAGFVTAFIYGLGAAFGLRHKDDIMPSTKSIAQLDIIFEQLSCSKQHPAGFNSLSLSVTWGSQSLECDTCSCI